MIWQLLPFVEKKTLLFLLTELQVPFQCDHVKWKSQSFATCDFVCLDSKGYFNQPQLALMRLVVSAPFKCIGCSYHLVYVTSQQKRFWMHTLSMYWGSIHAKHFWLHQRSDSGFLSDAAFFTKLRSLIGCHHLPVVHVHFSPMWQLLMSGLT
jgi:hypothetical protein